MTKPTTDSFTNFKIYVGDGNSPEAFTAPCGFVSKSLSLDAASSDTNVPDCNSPEEPAWTESAVTSLSATVSGNGVMAEESEPTWRAWWASGQAKNVRVEKHLGYWQGSAIITNLTESVALGTEGNKVQLSVSLKSAAAWVWVPAF